MTSWENLNRIRMIRRRGAESTTGEAKRGTEPEKTVIKADVAKAAVWLRENRDRLRADGRHPVPALQERFLLSSKEACTAIRLAHDLDTKAEAT